MSEANKCSDVIGRSKKIIAEINRGAVYGPNQLAYVIEELCCELVAAEHEIARLDAVYSAALTTIANTHDELAAAKRRIEALEGLIMDEATEVAAEASCAWEFCTSTGIISESTSNAFGKNLTRFFRSLHELMPDHYAHFKDACDGNDPELYEFLTEIEDARD